MKPELRLGIVLYIKLGLGNLNKMDGNDELLI